jgi:hypothetical protein
MFVTSLQEKRIFDISLSNLQMETLAFLNPRHIVLNLNVFFTCQTLLSKESLNICIVSTKPILPCSVFVGRTSNQDSDVRRLVQVWKQIIFHL